jgi:hypothetical protein
MSRIAKNGQNVKEFFSHEHFLYAGGYLTEKTGLTPRMLLDPAEK